MNFSKVGRPSKGQITCFFCRTGCAPKNGDWFVSLQVATQQIFSCRGCEAQVKGKYKPAYSIRRYAE